MSDDKIIDEVLAEHAAERKTFADQIKNPPKIPAKLRSAAVHNLKINRQPYDDLISGAKTSEVRDCSDRDFQVGDSVELFMTETSDGFATESIVRKISHIQLGYGLPDGLCVLSYESALRQQLADVSNERDVIRLEIDACAEMARMIEEREWAEHVGIGEASSAVEHAFTQLHNELSESRELSDSLQSRLNASEVLLREMRHEDYTRLRDIADMHNRVDAHLVQSTTATTPTYEVQWNSIHGPGGWKVVTLEEYQRCQGPLWDRRTTDTVPAKDEQGAGS